MPLQEVEDIPLAAIQSYGRHRKLNDAAVNALAESIAKIGLKTPITVSNLPSGDARLISGAHRVAALKVLGKTHVPSIVVDWDDVEQELWEISENLHRSDLTALERSEHIDRWRELVKDRKGAQVAHPGGQQPHEQGVSGVAKELNVSRREVERSRDIASLTDEAKDAARETGLDDNQSRLVETSKLPPEEQASNIHRLAERKKVSNFPKDEHEESQIWRGKFASLWAKAPRQEDQEWAADYIDKLAPVFDRTKAGQA